MQEPIQDQKQESQVEHREVEFEHSTDLASLLTTRRISLLVSTYQAGKLILVGANKEGLVLSFHNFDRPMGLAVDDRSDTMAVAARDKIWLLRNARDVAAQMKHERYSDCFLSRSAHITGEIQSHEMAWGTNELWIVNTLFSCLCTLDPGFSFVPRWQPEFISEISAEDRCHLNGLAIAEGVPRFVTAMAETDTQEGWRPKKLDGGCLIDVTSNQVVARGFAMPHSPRIYQNAIWLLDSGRGALVRVDPEDGRVQIVARFPGYARGLAIRDSFAFVGLSRIRETSTFGGVPIAEHRERLKCGIAIVDLRTGKLEGQLEFKSVVEEIFDIAILPTAALAILRGPFAHEEGQKPIWVVPTQQ